MNQRSIFYLIFLIFPILCSSQSFEWEGYGKGLSYLKIKDGIVTLNCCDWAEWEGGNLKEVNDQWIIVQRLDVLGQDTINWKIEVLDPSYDSLRTGCERNQVTYYRPEFLTYTGKDPFRQYHFQDVKLEYLSNWDGKNYVIEFNRFGLLRFADYDNTTLFEEKLDPSVVDQFKELIKYIDINNLNACHGMTNTCSDPEISFMFRDGYFNEYSYKALYVPVQLTPVKAFFEEILKSKGHPVEWPRRY